MLGTWGIVHCAKLPPPAFVNALVGSCLGCGILWLV